MMKTAKKCRVVLLVALAALFLCSAVCPVFPAKSASAQTGVTAQAQTVEQETDVTTKDSFLIGGYESYYPHNKPTNQEVRPYAEQTAALADLGLNFAFTPYRWTDWSTFFASSEDRAYWEDYGVKWDDSYDAETFWNYVDTVYRENNMVYLMEDRRLGYPSKTDIMVDWAKDLTNCIGYHVADEPHPDQFAYWADIVKEYLQKDPERYPIVNMLPYVPQFGMEYRDFLEAWVEAAGAENISYLSHDIYPIVSGGYRSDFYGMLEDMRYVAYENGKLRTHAYPQSCQWNGTRMPNANELRWNVYSYIAYGFKALSYYNIVTSCGNEFFDDETFAAMNHENYTTAIIHWDGTIPNQELYDSFKELNWEIRAMGDILMDLDTAHAYHTLQNASGVEYLPKSYPIQPKGSEDLIISEMLAKDGTESHIMLLNKSQSKSVKPTLEISSDSIEGLQWFNTETKQYEKVTLTNGEFTVELRPGEGKLFRVAGSLHGETISHSPRISLLSGEYNRSLSVNIELPAGITAESGAQIRYTLDGSNPTMSSPLYVGPLTFELKEGGVQKYYLRAAVVQNGKVGDATYREYLLTDYDGYDKNLYSASADSFISSGGTFSRTNGIYELTSYDTGTPSYAYKTALGKAFTTEGTFCIINPQGAAGFRLQNALSDATFTVDIFVDTGGVLQIKTNDTVLASKTLSSVDFAGFKLRVFRYFEDITVYIDDTEVLSAYIGDAGDAELYASVASDGALFAAANWRARSFAPDYVVAKHNIVSIDKIPGMTVERYTSKEDILAMLPTEVTCSLEEGISYGATVIWDSPLYDRTQSGLHLFYGTIVLAQDSPVANSDGLQAQISVLVRYDLDVWELQQLMDVVDGLNESDYTETSWAAVASAYKSAQTIIRERNDTQQGVEPIRRNLQAAIQALVNPSIDWSKISRLITTCESMEADDYTVQSYAAFSAIVQEVKAMSTTGPYDSNEATNRMQRLDNAIKMLVERGDPAELNEKIAAARSVNAESYSQSSYDRLIAAVEAAETLVQSGNATQEDLEYAGKAIDSAQAALSAPASISGGEASGCGSQTSGSAALVATTLLGAAIFAIAARRKSKKNVSKQ